MMPQLRNRRTVALIAVAGALGLWVFIASVLMPLNESGAALDKKIRAARADLVKITKMADTYIPLAAAAPSSLLKETASGPIADDLQSIAARTGANRFMKKFSPSSDPKTGRQNEATATFEKIPYALLMDLLQAVHENSSGIGVRRARITAAFDNRNNVNAEITFSRGF